MNSKNEISDNVKRVLKNIEEKDYSKKELQNTFNNITANKEITDYEKEVLIELVEKTLRIKHPNAAKKMFGSKEAKARELLENLFVELKDEFDWINNRVDTKIKTGGDMIGGRQHVCLYISYKNDLGVNTGFIYRQLTADSEPFIEVHIRQVRTKNEESRMIEEKKFAIEAEDEAVSLYKKFLSDVI